MSYAYETASYDDLCGCVSVSLPTQMQDQDNHYPTEYLQEVVKKRLNNPANQRWVEANCPKCGGLGLKPEED